MYVYVGTMTAEGEGNGEGIYVYQFDPENGTLTHQDTVVGAPNPAFLAIDPSNRFVFAANETMPGLVSSFHRDQNTGSLHELNRDTSHGDGPCYISTDVPGRYVLVANYGDGTLSVYPLAEDGHIQPSSDVLTSSGSGSDPDRQDGPHAHMIAPAPDGHHVLATDLGLDTITVYELDTNLGQLNLSPGENAVAHAEPGSGPRHFAFAADGVTVYVINELNSTIDVYAFQDGGLARQQTVSTLPDDHAGDNFPSQIVVSPDGRHVYGANRGADTIAIFAVGADGNLTPSGQVPCGGAWPRNINIDPVGNWVIAANQRSGNLALFRRDPETGGLTPSGEPVAVPSPMAVLFAEI